VLGRLGRNPATIREILFGEDVHGRAAAYDRAVARDAEVTPEESAWLKQLLDADGARDPLEQALLDFLEADGVKLQ